MAPSRDTDDNPPPPESWTFLALELEGCPQGGVSVRLHQMQLSTMRTPASAEHVALVREADDNISWGEPLATSAFRSLALPGRDLTIVSGNGTWVIRGQHLLHERFNGDIAIVVEAGPRTFFRMSAPSEDWSSSIEHFRARIRCDVQDNSGTPLNVRTAPRGNATITRALENGASVEVGEAHGSWRRLRGLPGEADEWVHESGLRCEGAAPEE